MYCGFVGNTAKDAVGVYPDIDACRNKNIDASKDSRYLNSTVLFNNSISQIALHTAKNGRKLRTLKYFAIVVQITAREGCTTSFRLFAFQLQLFHDLICLVAK